MPCISTPKNPVDLDSQPEGLELGDVDVVVGVTDLKFLQNQYSSKGD